MPPPRSLEAELLDDPALGAQAVQAALREIRWVNRWLGGRHALRRGLAVALRDVPRGGTVEALDVGSGDATLPAAVVRWAARRGWRLRWVALDRSAAAAVLCRDVGRPAAVIQADALAMPFRERSFDVVVASMFLHHFPAPAVIDLLRNLRRLARIALVINDLRRSRLAWAGIWALSRALGSHPVFAHDAPLSVRRGFTAEELQAAAHGAGIQPRALFRCWAFRLVLVAPGMGV